MKNLLQTNPIFNNIFNNIIALWKRFIDDGGGISRGTITEFMNWYNIMKEHFRKFELELTADTDSHTIDGDNYVEKETAQTTFLDIDMYKDNNNMHTKEHRKETASNSYIKFGSAHPSHSFKGIVKSQMYRLRRLCSKDGDFISAIENLKIRCYNSGYDKDMVDGILDKAKEM